MILHKSKGFTLVELVIVIAILGILAGIAIPYFLDSQAKTRSAKAAADMRTLQSAVEQYMAAGNTVNFTGNSRVDGNNLFLAMQRKGFIAYVPIPPKGDYYVELGKSKIPYDDPSYGIEESTDTTTGEHRQIRIGFITTRDSNISVPYDTFINMMILGIEDV